MLRSLKADECFAWRRIRRTQESGFDSESALTELELWVFSVMSFFQFGIVWLGSQAA
jgi:hypothetical protein